MALAFASLFNPTSERKKNWIIFGALVLITLLRNAALVITPLDLGVDEAQYWVWSLTPDFGYFTKPPLIAWIIAVTHWLFGHHTWAVRLPACWIHFGTALLLWRGATFLYSQKAGRLAGLIWITLPATGLGSFLISTDTPLLALWSTGLLALCGIVSGRLNTTVGMTLAGLAFGAAMLAKFAAIYALVGLALMMLQGYLRKRQIFGWRHFVIAFIAFSVAASPNIIWNFTNDFSAVRHLGDNANISQYSASLAGVWYFISNQFAVAGPLMFTFMLIAVVSQWRNHETNWLIWMCAPVIALIIIQSYLSETNANWTVTAFPALTIMVAGWLANRQNHRFTTFAISINLSLVFFILLVTIGGSMGPLTPKSDPLRRLRGWNQLAADIMPHISAHRATAVIADRRATASLLSWHLHNTQLNILVHDSDGVPSNHFEANHSWSSRHGRRLIALTGNTIPPSIPGVNWTPQSGTSHVTISQNKKRRFTIYRGTE